ncbi:hypothetical protein [Streptomyces hokutonensis]|uniref:hypothetical protein n=1 Tax=Streptomyces hokutonensis TaxID=1306990 RepID=UPI00037EDF7A|nr:hypothetical protein [Streptomyces hokutonensis]
MPCHVAGGHGERAERAGEGTGGESSQARDERGDECARNEIGDEAQRSVVAEPVGPLP